MNFTGWNNFEDFIRACGYNNSRNNNNNNNNNNSTNQANNDSSNGCYDIPNGFQSLNPELFVIIGALLGEIIAGNIPFNVQNALGNWFSLIGQVIMTYNSQQQYFEQGPGTCFNPKNFNSNNSSCSNNNSNNNNNNNSSSSSSNKNNVERIKKLESQIDALINEISNIKNNL